jgi:hypothetical protein
MIVRYDARALRDIDAIHEYIPRLLREWCRG